MCRSTDRWIVICLIDGSGDWWIGRSMDRLIGRLDWIGRWMDGWMDGLVDGSVDGWIGGWLDL